jgi:hypothetical protein
MGTITFADSVSDDHLLDLDPNPGRAPMRSRGSILQTGLTLGTPPPQPSIHRLAGHPGSFCSLRHRPTELLNPIHQ